MKFKTKFILVSTLLIAMFVALNVYVYMQGAPYIISALDLVPHSQAAIILGAAVTQKGIPSSVLEDRVITAINLYKEGKVDKILMSGGNATVANNEVDPVRKMLIAQGIPKDDIFLDHAGFDTYSTMYRAKAIFKISSAIVVTQDFHLPRALYTARSLGIRAYGLRADRGQYSIRNYMRELLSRPNAFLDVLIHRTPKYLGPAVPISGDGNAT
jgi:SanA protein